MFTKYVTANQSASRRPRYRPISGNRQKLSDWSALVCLVLILRKNEKDDLAKSSILPLIYGLYSSQWITSIILCLHFETQKQLQNLLFPFFQ